MEFSCSRGVLFDTLAVMSGVVKKNPPLLVLSNVLVSAEAEGRLHLFSTDLEVGVICSIPAQVSAAGELSLPARKLTDILRELPEAQVSLATEGTTCTVRCENSRFSLMGIDAEDFPAKPDTSTDSSLTLVSPSISLITSATPLGTRCSHSSPSTILLRISVPE